MRILYITSSLPFGKGESFVIPEMAEMRALGHELFLAPLWPRGKRIHDCSHLVTELLCTRKFPRLSNLSRAFPAIRELLAGVKGWTALRNLLAIFRAAQLTQAIEEHGIEHIHCHWAGCTASLGMVLSAVTGIPWSLTAHRWDIAANNCFTAKAESASFVRFISHSGRSMANQLGIKGLTKSLVIHMGVPLVSDDQLPAQPSDERLSMLCPANLLPVKGHSDLLAAVRLLTDSGVDCELHLAGDGPLRKDLEAQAEQLGLGSNVKFLGALKHDEVLDFYRRGLVSLVVLPSRDLGAGLHEGIPVSLIEAMSYRVAVVSTQTGGIPELVTANDGILVPPGDPRSLAHAIRTLLESPETREQLGRSGRKRVEEYFSVKKTAAELAQLFGEYAVMRTHGRVQK